MVPTEGPLMAIDVGEVRTGIACSDPAQSVAHPVGTVARRRGKRFPLRALRTHLDACKPVGIVVGLPLTAEGTENASAAAARAIGALIHEKSGIPVVFWDERMSTARVLATKKEVGHHRKVRDLDTDALAATVILQNFLDSRRP